MSRRDLLDEFELGRRVWLHLAVENDLPPLSRETALQVRCAIIPPSRPASKDPSRD